jgi:PAS domain S-box-containing protein
VEVTVAPIFGDAGGVAKTIEVCRDVTAQKRAEKAQKDLLRRLQAIMDTVRAAIFLKDADMRYVAVNEPYYELLPQGIDDVTGLCDRDMFPERPAARFEKEDCEVLETGEPLEKEDRVRLRSGRGAHMAVSLSPVLDGDGQTVGLVGIAYDISEQKRVEAALSRSNQELEQFAYVASHDLQEPLRMVSSYCQLISRRYQGQLDEDADEFIHYAVDGASRMQRLIEDLLQYSRVNTRGKPPEPTEADDVLTGVLADLGVHIEEAGPEVTHDPLPQVMADPVQLGRLFQNLVSNAIKYRGEDPPRIHIGAARQNGQWRFSVQDNGAGIDPQFHDRVFVIFQRLQARDETSGTGIGLAVCKRIVERHGGRIWVESAEGKGSTFYFTIPAHEQNEEAEEYDYASAGA